MSSSLLEASISLSTHPTLSSLFGARFDVCADFHSTLPPSDLRNWCQDPFTCVHSGRKLQFTKHEHFISDEFGC